MCILSLVETDLITPFVNALEGLASAIFWGMLLFFVIFPLFTIIGAVRLIKVIWAYNEVNRFSSDNSKYQKVKGRYISSNIIGWKYGRIEYKANGAYYHISLWNCPAAEPNVLYRPGKPRKALLFDIGYYRKKIFVRSVEFLMIAVPIVAYCTAVFAL